MSYPRSPRPVCSTTIGTRKLSINFVSDVAKYWSRKSRSSVAFAVRREPARNALRNPKFEISNLRFPQVTRPTRAHGSGTRRKNCWVCEAGTRTETTVPLVEGISETGAQELVEGKLVVN